MQRLSLSFPILVRTERQLRDVRSTNTGMFSGFFYVLLTVHLSIILVIDQFNAQILVS